MPRAALQRYLALAALVLAALAGLYLGWRLFWYLTDDAYIAFRYISNAHLGYGYVWNPPPFKPVEGYTSFLWVVLLDVVWRLTGLEPPEAANGISLAFAAGTLLLTTALVWRLRLRPALERWRLPLLALVLLFTLTNRTFLAWTSSGLETAMFNFWLTAWVFVAVAGEPPGGSLKPNTRGWLALLAGAAALMALTRPDGLLFIGATLALAAVDWRGRRRARGWTWRQAASLLPLALPAAHLLWRRATYGAWLPNTYVAKDTGPWPESGVRYLLSFVMEYALWFWLAVALVLAVLALRRAGAWPSLARRWLAGPVTPGLAQTAAVSALAAHFAYYTLIIGGDHFEYRVYSHLVPLLPVALVWMLNALAVRPAWALGVMAVSLAASLPLPWTHFALSRQYSTRFETWAMRVAVAPSFPAPLRPYAAAFDSLQAWLIERSVGIRHQEHKIFIEYQLSTLPPREAGLLLSPSAQAVRIEGAVGAIGWVLPTVAIIDRHGLNDLAIARHPLDPTRPRIMAHDRVPPEGYMDCFQANAAAPISKIIVGQRATDLNALVPVCENTDWPLGQWGAGLIPAPNMQMAPAAARVIDNVWMPDPIFVYYVPPEQAPVQPAAALWEAFTSAYDDTGCVVFPPVPAPDGAYAFAFLPANLRYAPEELAAVFPWASIVDYKRTGRPVPYNLAYAVPADFALPAPAVPHVIEWGPAMLLGYRLVAEQAAPGGRVPVELYLRVRGPAPTEQWFRLALAAAGAPEAAAVAVDQADPCRGLYAAMLWEAGQVIVAKAQLWLPPDLAPGDYAVQVGMFDLAVGPDAPLPAEGETTLAIIRVEPE